MATIRRRILKSGRSSYQIDFFLHGARKTLSLGSRFTAKQVESIRTAVEDITAVIETGGRVGRTTAGFIADMTADLRSRFIRAGLLVEPELKTNGELWAAWLKKVELSRKPGTVASYEAVEKRFFRFFSRDTHPAAITVEDAEAWAAALKTANYAGPTIGSSIRGASIVFNWAVEREIIEKNPFKHIQRPPANNPDRALYIPMDWYEKMLDACSRMGWSRERAQEWRTLLALCRIIGIRGPSEMRGLTWGSVNEEERSITIHSPKTEHHPGKESRVVPLFPMLKVELVHQRIIADTGKDSYILPYIRTVTVTTINRVMKRLAERAGLPVTKRIFPQNMRVSASNDIADGFGWVKEAAWVGHANEVARKHYFTVTDADFQRAGQDEARTDANKKTGEEEKTLPSERESMPMKNDNGIGNSTGENLGDLAGF